MMYRREPRASQSLPLRLPVGSPNLVTMIRSSRLRLSSRIAVPNMVSDSPGSAPYRSAISKKPMPASTAAAITALVPS